MPAGVASPKAWVAWSTSPRSAPFDAGRSRGWIDADPAMRDEIDHETIVDGAESGSVVTAAPNGDRQETLFANSTAAITSAASTGRAISAGRLSIMPF